MQDLLAHVLGQLIDAFPPLEREAHLWRFQKREGVPRRPFRVLLTLEAAQLEAAGLACTECAYRCDLLPIAQDLARPIWNPGQLSRHLIRFGPHGRLAGLFGWVQIGDGKESQPYLISLLARDVAVEPVVRVDWPVARSLAHRMALAPVWLWPSDKCQDAGNRFGPQTVDRVFCKVKGEVVPRMWVELDASSGYVFPNLTTTFGAEHARDRCGDRMAAPLMDANAAVLAQARQWFRGGHGEGDFLSLWLSYTKACYALGEARDPSATVESLTNAIRPSMVRDSPLASEIQAVCSGM